MRRIFIICLHILFFNGYGQNDLLFENYQSNDLSSHEVRSIYKDKRGYLWLATENGLSRFDGLHFDTFNETSGHEFSKNLSETNYLLGDENDDLWIASKGVLLLNQTGNSFRQIPFVGKAQERIVPPVCVKIQIDSAKTVWALSDNEIFLLQDSVFVPASARYPSLLHLRGQMFPARAFLYDGLRNGFWIGVRFNGLFFLDLKTGSLFGNHNNPENVEFLNATSSVYCLTVRHNDLWFYSANPMTLHHIKFDSKNRFTGVAERIDLKGMRLTTLFLDFKNRLWASSWGLKIYLKEEGREMKLVQDYETIIEGQTQYRFPAGHFHCVYEDEKQNLWFGTNGLAKLEPNSSVKKFFSLVDHRQVRKRHKLIVNRIVRLDDSLVLICSGKGLVKFNQITESKEIFEIKDGTEEEKIIYDVQNFGDTWWCATGGGIKLFDMRTRVFRPLDQFPEIKPDHVKKMVWLLKDHLGYIWFCTWNDGLFRYDPKQKQTEFMADSTRGDIAIKNSLCAFKDSKGNLWFGYGNSGVRCYDFERDKFFNPVSGIGDSLVSRSIVSAITEDGQGNIYLSTLGNGLIKISDGKVVFQYSKKNGLSSNHVNESVIDKLGNIWIATNTGFHKIDNGIDVAHEVLIHFGRAALNVSGRTSGISKFEDRVAAISFNAFALLDPQYNFDPTSVEPPRVSRIITQDSIYNLIPASDVISLEAGVNTLSIIYASLDHSKLPSLQYQFKLEGFDTEWQNSYDRTYASYAQLTPGTYDFRIRTSVNGINWVESPSVTLRIEHFFWQTTWFKILSVMAALVIAYLIFQIWARRRVRQKLRDAIAYFAKTSQDVNSIDEICHSVTRNSVTLLNLNYCSIYLMDETDTTLVLRAVQTSDQKFREIFSVRAKDVFAGIQHMQPVVENGFKRKTSFALIPIVAEQHIIGVLHCGKDQRNFFTEALMASLTTISSINATKLAEAKAQAVTLAREKELLEINTLLAETKFMSLRSQMTPHFVFNCLNNIQHFFFIKEYSKASYYLSTFARLLRHILQNATDNFITIEEEIKVLTFYLELEQLRFENPFTFTIVCDSSVHGEMFLPTMLLQPFVENAIIHGLMPVKGQGAVIISFARIGDELICRVEDNGIGRDAANKKRNILKDEAHQSKGVLIVQDRLALLSKKGFPSTLEITDNVPNGTIVEIRMRGIASGD